MSALSRDLVVSPGGVLGGTITVPGDKSISHRSIMLASIARGKSIIDGFLAGEDALATLAAFQEMGVPIEGPHAGRVEVDGVGMRGLQRPSRALDLGNSGTALRLLAGLLAGQGFDTELTGDSSLCSRPMGRVTEPLTLMGARVEASESGTPPLRIFSAGGRLRGIEYTMPIPSAQVKSCLLLAGLYANGRVCVTEPATTRDHTERMLRGFGYTVERHSNTVCLEGGRELRGARIEVPGDISSAAFFLVAASIAPGSDLLIERVGVNPTRGGALEILRMMGGDLQTINRRETGGEPVADIRVRSASLRGIDIPEELVSLAIDEFPVLFVAAACAKGTTTLSGAGELRFKESDRIESMAKGLRELGIRVEVGQDGMTIHGGELAGGRVESFADHRVAMAFAVAGIKAERELRVTDCANVATSFPGFCETARRAGMNVVEETR